MTIKPNINWANNINLNDPANFKKMFLLKLNISGFNFVTNASNCFNWKLSLLRRGRGQLLFDALNTNINNIRLWIKVNIPNMLENLLSCKYMPWCSHQIV